MANSRKASIVTGTCTVNDLLSFQKPYIISIPDYQRPYLWDKDKLEALINDLKYHLANSPKDYYYLGGVLFYKIENQYEIIDGQQRLTSILILDHIAKGENSLLSQHKDRLHFYFNSPISQQGIALIKNYLKDSKEDWLKENWQLAFNKMVFSVIITENQDEAFYFFETQNNRGVKLSSVDFLKSYHLRELKGYNAKQAAFAQKWDRNNKNQFLAGLYNRILWRSRSWKGKTVEYEDNDAVLNEFQKKSLRPDSVDTIHIFPNIKNTYAQVLKYNEQSGITLEASPNSLQPKELDYPFAIRQPLEKGVGFFLYTEKYAKLYHHIFDEKHDIGTPIGDFQHFFQQVYKKSNMSEYLVELFRLCSISFYDKFETNKLLKFAHFLDFFIGVYRIELNSIVAQTPVKILRDKSQNLLDIIASAYTPKEVFDFILENTDNEIYKKESIIIDHKVKGRYKKGLIDYYKKEVTSLANKIDWIK